ncbi:hypothetical protein, partial [Vibrio cholerae]|uniref:hypothetical protein n=1 Tax=Vibrio cholerae TaxID=666 RepID=UPI001963ADC6
PRQYQTGSGDVLDRFILSWVQLHSALNPLYLAANNNPLTEDYQQRNCLYKNLLHKCIAKQGVLAAIMNNRSFAEKCDV